MISGRAVGLREDAPQAWQIAQHIIRETMPRGLMVRPMGSMVIMSPPLIITRAEIDELAAILRARRK
ncbi:hypothetical protein ACVDG5_026915 [Mesorhizobium sp. ORM6]